MEINDRSYKVGELSFTDVGEAVKNALKEVFGDYRTVPYAFNSEMYKNKKFKAEVLALGFDGMFRFEIKERLIFCFHRLHGGGAMFIIF